MWPFANSNNALERSQRDVLDRLAELEKVLKRLCDDVEEIDQKYTSLRGMVYAKKLHKQPPEDDPGEQTTAAERDTSKMTRAELKAYLTRSGRFIPGHPAKHQE